MGNVKPCQQYSAADKLKYMRPVIILLQFLLILVPLILLLINTVDHKKREDVISYARAHVRYDLCGFVFPRLYGKKVSGEFSLSFLKAKWLASKVRA